MLTYTILAHLQVPVGHRERANGHLVSLNGVGSDIHDIPIYPTFKFSGLAPVRSTARNPLREASQMFSI